MDIKRPRRTAAIMLTGLALATVGMAAEYSPAPSAATTLSIRLASATRVAQATNGTGYWLATADGGVYTFGTANFYGSLAGRHLNSPITGIVATADAHGYWLVAKDGGVFAFGDAVFSGSLAAKDLDAPVVGIASGKGSAAASPGPQGPRGAPGPVGPAVASHYAYIYNLAAQTVAIEADVMFDSNGPMSGFAHATGSAAITVTSAGVYRIEFSASATPVSQFTVTVNGIVAPQATYGSGAGTQQNNGQAILSLPAGAVLTMRNHSSAAAVGLPTVTGGTQANVNASVLIEQLG